MNHLIVDGFGLAFRSHFAFSTLSTQSGLLSGCVYGFLVGIRSIKSKYPDFRVVIAWDLEARRKKEKFSEYKANRSHFDLSEQIRDLKTIFSTVSVSQGEVLGEEADDVIATLAARFSQEGKVYIYSSDKDLLQLVENGKVIVINPETKNCFDEEAVKQKFGVYPKDLACFLALRGDTVDNIPGIPRVPSKLIAALSGKYNSPRSIYASLGEETLTDFQKKSFGDFENQVYVNFELTNLRRDLDVNLSKGEQNTEKLQSYLTKYEIKSINAEKFAELFSKESTFNQRQGPAIINYSLFEENQDGDNTLFQKNGFVRV